MNDTVDGEYQNYKAKGGRYTRENPLAKPWTEMVENLLTRKLKI